ncbi:hypothetical protein ACLOJK_010179 [Asimina triloba]
MTRENTENGRDDMVIDRCIPEERPQQILPDGFSAEYLKVYYDGKHPACDPSYIGRREISFTLDGDIYLRFQSFNNPVEFENSINEKCPFKIDIGPVYSVDPAKRHAYAQSGDKVFTPVERELIFDIDMSDYDDVRYCCSGADICLKCWPLMTIAIKVIDTALRGWDTFSPSCFHYAMILVSTIYSGYTVADVVFIVGFVMGEQEGIAADLQARWQDNRRSSVSKEDINFVRWEQLKLALQSGKQKSPGVRRCVEEIVFSYTYPRLDMEVSKHMNHLLKAPFCVHPKTGRVCIPIDPNNCDEFDPTAVPTLSELLEELNTGGPRVDVGSGGTGKYIQRKDSTVEEQFKLICRYADLLSRVVVPMCDCGVNRWVERCRMAHAKQREVNLSYSRPPDR